jgi:ZIP family zinc transporter
MHDTTFRLPVCPTRWITAAGLRSEGAAALARAWDHSSSPVAGNVGFAFLLTAFAGLSTGIGSFFAFFGTRARTGFLSFALGLSAGVMIYVSMVEMMPTSEEFVRGHIGERAGGWISVGSMFLGILLAGVIDALVPQQRNPHEARSETDLGRLKEEGQIAVASPSLARAGLLTAIALAVHNFPEGMVTFMAALADVELGVSIAVAVAIHNIPEGISVSVPIYYVTQDKTKAFAYSFLSGLAEPAGALVGYAILRPFLNDLVLGVSLGTVAGIMLYVSFDELLPAAREYAKGHTAIAGLVVGMAIMAVSLLLLR